MNEKERLKLIREAEEKRDRSVGVRLRDLAFQRRPEDYDEVTRLLSILQERKMDNEPLFSEDYEGIDIAQSYLREVQKPKKLSQ